jgi:hypothetical protein
MAVLMGWNETPRSTDQLARSTNRFVSYIGVGAWIRRKAAGAMPCWTCRLLRGVFCRRLWDSFSALPFAPSAISLHLFQQSLEVRADFIEDQI